MNSYPYLPYLYTGMQNPSLCDSIGDCGCRYSLNYLHFSSDDEQNYTPTGNTTTVAAVTDPIDPSQRQGLGRKTASGSEGIQKTPTRPGNYHRLGVSAAGPADKSSCHSLLNYLFDRRRQNSAPMPSKPECRHHYLGHYPLQHPAARPNALAQTAGFTAPQLS